MNAPAETLIERRSANQALLESRLGECIETLRRHAILLEVDARNTGAAAIARSVASRSEDALRTIRDGDAL